jgi:hypothetical protein
MQKLELIQGEPRSVVSVRVACLLLRTPDARMKWAARYWRWAKEINVDKKVQRITKMAAATATKLSAEEETLLRYGFEQITKDFSLEKKLALIEDTARSELIKPNDDSPFSGLLVPPFKGEGRGPALERYAGDYLLLRTTFTPRKLLLVAYMRIFRAEGSATPLRFTTQGYSAGFSKEAKQVDGYMYTAANQVFAIGRLFDSFADSYTDEIRSSISRSLENPVKRVERKKEGSGRWPSDNIHDLVGIRLGLNRDTFLPRGYYVWAYRLLNPLTSAEIDRYVYDFPLDSATPEQAGRLEQLKALVLGYDRIAKWLDQEKVGDLEYIPE